MTMYVGPTYGPGLGGLNNGQYRAALATAPGGATYTTNPANMGALASIPYQAPKVYPPPVESAGIRTGEITAFRAWILDGDFLHSVHVESYRWLPKTVEKAHAVSTWHGEGIHAFKTYDQVKHCYPWPCYFYGEVALWGDVIEYEHGYKAEFAKVTKIYSTGGIFKRWRVRQLRRKYGV